MPQRHPALVSLSHDHHRGLVLAHRLQSGSKLDPNAPDNSPGTRIASLRQFFNEHLKPHFIVEEEVLFPLLHKMLASVVPLVPKLVEEHRTMESLLERPAGGSEVEAEATLKNFGLILEGHIRTEERELFPAIEEEGTEELLTTLAERMKPYEQRRGT